MFTFCRVKLVTGISCLRPEDPAMRLPVSAVAVTLLIRMFCQIGVVVIDRLGRVVGGGCRSDAVGRSDRVVEVVENDRVADVGHRQVAELDILDQAADVAIGFEPDALIGAVECAVADEHIMHSALDQAANGHAVPDAKGAVRNGDIRRDIGAASNLDIVVSVADRAVMNQHVGRSQIHPVRIGAMNPETAY